MSKNRVVMNLIKARTLVKPVILLSILADHSSLGNVLGNGLCGSPLIVFGSTPPTWPT
jgi:hypothetical protein